jgi:hypothetical protein
LWLGHCLLKCPWHPPRDKSWQLSLCQSLGSGGKFPVSHLQRHARSNRPSHRLSGVLWLTTIPVLVLGEVLELLLWRVVHPKEGPPSGVVSVPCHEDAGHHCPSLTPRGPQGDYRENGSEQRQLQNGEMSCLFSSLTNLWTQVRNRCSPAKVF